MKIYLASKSPRRHMLLKQMGVEYEVLAIDTAEEILPDETPEEYSNRVTLEKLDISWNKIVQEKLPLLPVLCADTEVVVDGAIYGKPKSCDDAYRMLKSYSGRSHEVITTTGIKFGAHQQLATNITRVFFKTIPDAEIAHYLRIGDYHDKAGAYGIQSYIGQFVYRIEGCFYAVMGLPLSAVRELLSGLPKNSVTNTAT